jgi:Ca2+-binding EF-hand superfamily protein
MHNKRIKSLINQVEDKVFNGKVKLFHVFRQFDKDGDGYVSYEDFENCLKSIKIDATKTEIASIVKLIDKKNNGYMNFSDFSKVFTPSMSESLVNIPQNDSYFPNLYPNKDIVAL